MQKSKQERQLDNFREHLRITKNELESVNNQLSKALSNKESVLIELNKMKEEEKDILTSTKNRLKELSTKKSELDNKEKTLFKKDKEIKETELASIKKIKAEQKKLDSDKQTHTQRIKELTNKIGQLEIVLLKTKSDLENNKFLLTNLTKELNDISKEKSKLDSLYYVKKEEYGNTIKDLDKQIKERLEYLNTIENKILKEQDLVGKSKKSFEEQERLLKAKKKNLDVIIARFNKTFKEHYPHLELKV